VPWAMDLVALGSAWWWGEVTGQLSSRAVGMRGTGVRWLVAVLVALASFGGLLGRASGRGGTGCGDGCGCGVGAASGAAGVAGAVG
jgi:hypothetical protein